MTAKEQTKQHISEVDKILYLLISELKLRAKKHDSSKLKSPEVEIFDIYTEKLKSTTYGSDEYKQYLKEMEPALQHHYANNDHHPEFHDKGIDDMNLLQIMEMVVDWFAATKRHADGDIRKSIEINKKRFNMSDQLCKILHNTVETLEKTNTIELVSSSKK